MQQRDLTGCMARICITGREMRTCRLLVVLAAYVARVRADVPALEKRTTISSASELPMDKEGALTQHVLLLPVRVQCVCARDTCTR